MALINQRTGYYGFTIDGLDGINSTEHGNVKKCIISIAYQLQMTDVDFSISNGAEDWAAQMGDGTIIPLSNPKVLFQNRDNSIIEFDMDTEYPANSPCILVYRSDTASFNYREHMGEARPYTENALSGHFAFTTEGYNGKKYENGYVDKILCTIPFPAQVSDIEFGISSGDDHWGARMGDGSIISLKNPEVLTTNADNAVIKFDMDVPYPSNSPCIIVYRSAQASYHLTPVTKPVEYKAVSDIIGVPESLTSGVTVDLSPCTVVPADATVQGIQWKIISGNATVDGDSLTVNGLGTIVIQATSPGGLTEEGEDFVKNFTIEVKTNKITILAQPVETVSMIYGQVNAVISVNAKSDTGVINYKWYQNTINSISGAIEVHNGNKSEYRIPVNINKGTYYYFCEISSPGATTVRSNMCMVDILIDLTKIMITPRVSSMTITQTSKFDITYEPNNARKPDVAWFSSDSNVIQIDNNGNVLVIDKGDVTITATTLDGRFSDSINISVPAYVSATDITDVISNITAGKNVTLTGTVVPANATCKDIQWKVIDTGNTVANINNNILYTESEGIVIIEARIIKGISPSQDFVKQFRIDVDRAFIPVTDINLVNFPQPIRADQTAEIIGNVVPANADHRDILWSISSPGSTGATIVDGTIKFTGTGTCTLVATVLKGTSETVNFTKEFSIKVNPAWVPVENIELEPSNTLSSITTTGSIS